MPRKERVFLKITARVAAQKFFLREMLFFFIKQRNKYIADDKFSFTAEDFLAHIKSMEFMKSMGADINNKNILIHLEILHTAFNKRNKNLTLNKPREPLINFTVTTDKTGFIIKNCLTEDLENAIKYLDFSLMLRHNVDDRIEDKEKDIEIGSLLSESLFSQNQEKKLVFCDRFSSKSLGRKERGIFDTLKKNFKKEVDCSLLYAATLRLTGKSVSRSEQPKYINTGVDQVKQKLFELSGNPEAILTIAGRGSVYKLVY